MKTATMKMVWGSWAVCLALGTLADDPAISDVVARQRWPWSRLVDIDYVLTCDSTQSVDVVVTAKDGSDTLTLPLASLTGDLYGISHGPHRIVWDPTVTSYTNNQMLTRFSVTLAPITPPLYMIVDLTKEAGADGQIAYVYEADLTNDFWGTWVRNPVTNNGTVVESVVWTGVTTNDIYKTDKLVLRRVPAGTFTMGSPATELGRVPCAAEDRHSVVLTRPFYLGVFELTQRQYEKIMNTNSTPSYFNNATYYKTRPVEKVNYALLRGSSLGTNWPSNASVDSGSLVGCLRSKTGINGFDLPTEAQWEYACRAGTSGALNDGTVNLTNSTSDARLNLQGRYLSNGGTGSSQNCSPTNGTAVVGSYQPNGWGLYDTHGNVWEYCLDKGQSSLGTATVTDPVGASVGTVSYMARGGGWDNSAQYSRSATRYMGSPFTYTASDGGVRIAIRLP